MPCVLESLSCEHTPVQSFFYGTIFAGMAGMYGRYGTILFHCTKRNFMDMQKPGPRGRSSSINPGPGAAVECKTSGVARGGCWCLELTDALFPESNAGINLTGYHPPPPQAPRGFCTKLCAQPQGFCTTENAWGPGQ